MMTEIPSAPCRLSRANSLAVKCMDRADRSLWLIEPGTPQEGEGSSRCGCAEKRRLVPVLVCAALLLLTVGVLGWFGLTRDTQDSKSDGSSPTASVLESRTSGIQEVCVKELPSAMLTAPFKKNQDGKYLHWESNFIHAFCHGGFHYHNHSLVVPVKGIYRVFLQITYEGEKCAEQTMSLRGTVLVHTDSYPQDRRLLSATDTTVCSQSSWRKSLYSAGLFRLDKGSRLRVIASPRDYMAKNEDEVFFGAEMQQLLPP